MERRAPLPGNRFRFRVRACRACGRGEAAWAGERKSPVAEARPDQKSPLRAAGAARCPAGVPPVSRRCPAGDQLGRAVPCRSQGPVPCCIAMPCCMLCRRCRRRTAAHRGSAFGEFARTFGRCRPHGRCRQHAGVPEPGFASARDRGSIPGLAQIRVPIRVQGKFLVGLGGAPS